MLNLKNKKVIAAVITQDNKVMIAQRAKNDSLYGKWEFPGGKVEEGESDQECLKRELREEFSINAEIGNYLLSSFFEHDGISYEMRAYYVPCFSGIIFLHDHQAIEWVLPEELTNFDMPAPDKPIVQEILKIKPSFLND